MFVDFNFGNFNDNLEIYTIEIKNGDNIRTRKMQTDSTIAQMQFMQLLQEVARIQQPVRIKISKDEEIWVQSQNKNRTLTNYIQFANKLYMEKYKEEF